MKFDEPSKVPMLIATPLPEEAARPNEKMIIDVDIGINEA